MSNKVEQAKLSEILSESLDIEETAFESDYEFRSHETWDSMAALTMIALIDEAFEVVLSASEFKGVNTLAELKLLIESKK